MAAYTEDHLAGHELKGKVGEGVALLDCKSLFPIINGKTVPSTRRFSSKKLRFEVLLAGICCHFTADMYGYEIERRVMTSVEEFQEAFQLFDNRGDGKINVNQIGDALRALGQNPTESDVKKFTHQHKPDERISFEVFLPIYQAISKGRTSDTADDFIEGLRHFDKDGNGFISSAELRHLLSTLGEKLTDDEVEQLLAGQEDSQGNINYEEFVRMVMSG